MLRKYKTIKHGVKLPGHKELSADAPIEVCPIPEYVTIPLWQHAGSPAKVCVVVGQTVLAGEKIADADGRISAPVHSSVSGIVTQIGTCRLAGGKESPSVTIKNDGTNRLATLSCIESVTDASPEQLINRIDQAGVVGLGGAAFPSKIKLLLPTDKKVDTLLINGAECEPYLTADYRLMVERPMEIVQGISALLFILGANRAVIGIETHSLSAITALRAAVAKDPRISIMPLAVKYPQGAEKMLIHAALKRTVPSGGLPVDVGVIVHNVGTVCAISDAIFRGRPLIERVVTVSGEAIARPANLLVRIGTPVSVLIDACGGVNKSDVAVICGGPMMGVAIDSLEIPVVKGTSGIVVIRYDAKISTSEAPVCINCGRCFNACPLGLTPSLLSESGAQDKPDDAINMCALDCCQCGACSVVCPAHRNNTDNIKKLKARILAKR